MTAALRPGRPVPRTSAPVGDPGLAFLVVGALLCLLLANARLSDRSRRGELRSRLRAAGIVFGERPDSLPPDEEE